MADWQRYREVLKDLYLQQDLPLRTVKEYMEETHQFEASKAQYERQFKIWDWRKNLTNTEWKYVASKIEERNRPSVVYFQGIKVSSEKIKKEIPRHVLVNDQFKLVSIPQSPEGLIVCTPPADSPDCVPTGVIGTILRKRKLPEHHSCHETPSPKRQQYIAGAGKRKQARLDVVSISEVAMYDHHRQRSMMERRPGTGVARLNLENLPYFKFQDFMRSPDIKLGFEQFFALGSKRLDTFLAPLFSLRLEDIDAPTHDLEPDEFKLLMPYTPIFSNPTPLCNTFGMALSGRHDRHADSLDALDLLKAVEDQFTIVIANTPQRDQSDVEANMELLRGPPTAQSAHLFVELAVHLHSNHLQRNYNIHGLTDWMMETIPWPVLRPILSRKLATIEAFAETFLLSAIQKDNIIIVRDLLEIPHLIAHVQASSITLKSAVRHSSTELVSLLLKAGADPSTADDSLLEFAKTIEVAEMLIAAGEDVNAIRTLRIPLVQGPALIGVVAQRNVQVAGYLLSMGADVNAFGGYTTPGMEPTPLSLAIDGCGIEMVKLLLKAGANVEVACIYSPVKYIGLPDSHCNPLTILDFEGCRFTALQKGARANLTIVRLLLEYGANVNEPACDMYGETALQAATSNGCIETVRLLLKWGANVNDNTNGDARFPKTVLHTAVEMGRSDLVEALLDANADVNARSFGKSSSSILEAAKLHQSTSKVMELLTARGGLDVPSESNSHRQIELRNAVYDGDFSAVTGLVRIGAHIDMSIIPGDLSWDSKPGRKMYYESRTILHWAIRHQIGEGFKPHRQMNVGLFKYLVENVQDVNAQNNNPALRPILHSVIESGNLELVRILIGAAADVNTTFIFVYPETPLILAAIHHQHDMALLLLSKGANVNAVVDDHDVDNHGDTTALQASMRSKWRPEGCINMAQLLLSHGAVVNARVAENGGRSELSLATQLGNQQFVQQLLRLGADVNSPPASRNGRTALQAAVRITPPNLNMVQLLLAEGANVNAPASCRGGMTALQVAASMGHFQIAHMLLKAGADVNAPPSVVYGDTALTAAARNGRLDMVYLLLEAGADLHVRVGIKEVWDSEYGIAADVARQSGHTTITEMLEEWEKTHGGLNDVLEVAKGTRKIVELNKEDTDPSGSDDEDIVEKSSDGNNYPDDYAD